MRSYWQFLSAREAGCSLLQGYEPSDLRESPKPMWIWSLLIGFSGYNKFFKEDTKLVDRIYISTYIVCMYQIFNKIKIWNFTKITLGLRTCVCVCKLTCTFEHTREHEWVVHVCVYECVCMYLNTHVHIYSWVCTYMYRCAYTWTHMTLYLLDHNLFYVFGLGLSLFKLLFFLYVRYIFTMIPSC